MSGNRPGFSVGGHAALSYMPPGAPPNVRTNPYAMQPGYPPQPPLPQQAPQYPPHGYPGMPPAAPPSGTNTAAAAFPSKLSVPEAIGLITIRLSKVEQSLQNMPDGSSLSSSSASANATDPGVLQSLVHRIDTLERGQSDDSTKQQVQRMSLDQAKHAEQLLRITRDLTETKDLLKTFMLKYDAFTQDMLARLDELSAAAVAVPGAEAAAPFFLEEDHPPISENDLLLSVNGVGGGGGDGNTFERTKSLAELD